MGKYRALPCRREAVCVRVCVCLPVPGFVTAVKAGFSVIELKSTHVFEGNLEGVARWF